VRYAPAGWGGACAIFLTPSRRRQPPYRGTLPCPSPHRGGWTVRHAPAGWGGACAIFLIPSRQQSRRIEGRTPPLARRANPAHMTIVRRRAVAPGLCLSMRTRRGSMPVWRRRRARRARASRCPMAISPPSLLPMATRSLPVTHAPSRRPACGSSILGRAGEVFAVRHPGRVSGPIRPAVIPNA
jgi:hypothetical protein